MATIPLELWEIKERIRESAERWGLDFFETIFEMVDYKKINEIAAYGGFPTRYPHWRYGMEYEQLSKSAEYGLSKIYEMVINNDPAYAYLLEGNNLVDQKTVIAHVYAHVDFFKNNYFFSKTNRKMVDAMANHAARVRRYIDRKGIEAVEDFIDTCLSIDNLIDYYSPFIERHPAEDDEPTTDELTARLQDVPRFAAKDYMESYINPEAFLQEQRQRMIEESQRQRKFPVQPERDVMAFLLEHAPLESWEADILSIVREESYYFAPQGQTKILNEGWACVAPETLVFTPSGLLPMAEVVAGATCAVCDGERSRRVLDRNIIRDHETIRLRTASGLEVTGSTNHRVLLADGETWRRLDELRQGDALARGDARGLWPKSVEPLGGAAKGARFDESLAALCGYIIGLPVARHMSGGVLLTCASAEHAGLVADLGHATFHTVAEVLPVTDEAGLAQVVIPSELAAAALLDALALDRHDASLAPLLKSPEPVVRTFLRALCDRGEVIDDALVITDLGATMSHHAQLLLSNYGVAAQRVEDPDTREHALVMRGATARALIAHVGLWGRAAREALLARTEGAPPQPDAEIVVSLERGRGDVYDITVEETHRYAAAGLIHHNSFWHSRILTTGELDDSEIIDFADINSRVMLTNPGQLNPYKLGVELLRDIEYRWNTGRFGKEWEEERDLERKASWDRHLGEGMEKIFQVRKLYNDVTFIDEFLTEDFARRNRMFSYVFNRKSGSWEIESREFATIKQRMLDQLTNFGQPFIYVRDGNFKNRSELLLHHRFEGVELRMDYARSVLESLYRIWKRPVNIETRLDSKGVLLTFDGSSHTEKSHPYEPL